MVVLALTLTRAVSVEYWEPAAGYYQAGDYASAVAEADKVLVDYPGDPFLLRIKGVALMDLQKTDLAFVSPLASVDSMGAE